MSGDVSPYVSLVTSEHADKTRFIRTVAASCQGWADLKALYAIMPSLYDVDLAIGGQLDVVGLWVGISRYLPIPISGVYFALDTSGVGFDQGVWLGPFDPINGLVALPDDYYRLVIKMRILNSHWDGSKETAYVLANSIFTSSGYNLFIDDNGDLSMNLGITGPGTPAPLVLGLLVNGLFNVKPVGVRINAYLYQSVAGPMFAFDLSSSQFAGFDSGAWATILVQ